MKVRCYSIIAIGLLFIGVASCKKLQPSVPAENELLDGPIEGLTAEQRQIFLRGDIAFNEKIFTKETGLGPGFVSTSCGSCHAGDGKGHPFTTLTRFGQSDETGNKFLHAGAPQLQNRAVAGYQPEQLPLGATFSRFTPPANTGLGFFDAVSDATILAMADPMDADNDGISGSVNWINLRPYTTPREGSVINDGKHIGRFGKKAGAYDLLHQTASAYNQDMGVTSMYEPKDAYSGEELDPEVTNQEVQDVVFYLRTLKAPIQRTANDPDVLNGKDLFIKASCNKCHVDELQTGNFFIQPLSNKTFHPYTDMLLHDMGPSLDDGYTEGVAKTYEWRTPALWGLGLSKNSQGGTYYLMHDGRAQTIDAAIMLHGGEALVSKQKYQSLSAQEKEKLIKFLESL